MAGRTPVLEWLRCGIPLSLLLDLASSEGPDPLDATYATYAMYASHAETTDA